MKEVLHPDIFRKTNKQTKNNKNSEFHILQITCHFSNIIAVKALKNKSKKLSKFRTS
jgi:hypothetical protein